MHVPREGVIGLRSAPTLSRIRHVQGPMDPWAAFVPLITIARGMGGSMREGASFEHM